jgi:hypothetical protein
MIGNGSPTGQIGKKSERILSFVETDRLALGYAGLLDYDYHDCTEWKGFPYIMELLHLSWLQMLINAFRRVDSLTTASVV